MACCFLIFFDSFVSLSFDPKVKCPVDRIWRLFWRYTPFNWELFPWFLCFGEGIWRGVSELLKLNLDCDSVYSEVVVAVSAQFPTDDKTLLLGNDLAGRLGFMPLPRWLMSPMNFTFPACVVTRAMSWQEKEKPRGLICLTLIFQTHLWRTGI